MSNANAIRLYAGSHPTLTVDDLARYFGVSRAVVITALGRGDALSTDRTVTTEGVTT